MKKEKPIKGGVRGCLNCGYTDTVLPMRTRLYTEMGGYMIFKNDKLYFMEKTGREYGKCKTLSFIERRARLDPNSDWRCMVDLPLRSAEYQRHGKSKWVLIKIGNGFV